jgi:hypothetical protein
VVDDDEVMVVVVVVVEVGEVLVDEDALPLVAELLLLPVELEEGFVLVALVMYELDEDEDALDKEDDVVVVAGVVYR